MWNLDAAKKQFVGNNHGSVDHSFWYHILKKQDQFELLNDPDLKAAFDWKPDRSNCPELNAAITELLGVIKPKWSNLLSEVFVGRSFEPEVNAWSNQRNGRAYVRLSFQYTTVLSAYIAAFDRFTDLAMRRSKGASIKDVFHGISISREHWADEQKFSGTHRSLLVGPKNRSAELYNGLTLPAEMFIVCHEYAHHLFGHTSRSVKSFGVENDLKKKLATHAVGRHIWFRNDSQKDELISDVLGLKLAATPGGSDTQIAYGTLIGAVCALVAEADIKNHWYADSSADYPSTSDRIGLLLSLAPSVFINCKPFGEGSIPHLAEQLRYFAIACRQSSLHSTDPQRHLAPTWDSVNQAAQNKDMDFAR